MTYQPPEHPVVPPTPTGAPQPSRAQPYAVADRPPVVAPVAPSGLTSDGNVVTVRPWRSSNVGIAHTAQVLLGLLVAGTLLVALLDLRTKQSLVEHDLGSVVRTLGLSNDLFWVGVASAGPSSSSSSCSGCIACGPLTARRTTSTPEAQVSPWAAG